MTTDGQKPDIYLTDGRKICVSKSLIEYELMLEGADCLRVHKSYLVNLHHIKEYRRGEGGVIILSNNAEIYVSRRRKDVFMENVKRIFKV